MIKWIYIFLIIFLLPANRLVAQQIFPNGGSGSYRLDYPGYVYAHHIYAPIGDNTTSHIHKGPNYTGPFQTHQWWTSALWDHGNIVADDGAHTLTDLGHEAHSAPMHPHPLIVEAKAEGYILRYGTADINGLNSEIEYHSAVIDTRVGLSGQTCSETSVDSYGDWHAVFYQNYGGGNTLRMTSAKGCPFAFFQRTGNINPYIFGLGKNIVTKSSSGNSFIFTVAPEGRPINFGVFLPPGSQIGNNGAPNVAVSTVGLGTFGCCWDNMNIGLPAGSNYFTIAIMPNTTQATLNMYEARAFNFITGTNHTYNFDEALSKLTTTFDVTTTNVYGGANTGTLQALYKHQYLYSPEAAGAANTGLTYISPRGNMKVLSTNTFTTVMTHQGLLPNLAWANKYSKAQMKNYIDNYLPTIAIPQSPADGYNKDAFVELANVAQIASQIGYTAAKNRCLDAMQSRLTDWLTSPTNQNWAIFVYNNNFNYMAHYPNGFTSSGEFIDMHFHMGYLIYGAAILARFRPAWAVQYGAMVETVIRQINDYRKDMSSPGNIGWFPYLRFFDPYAGHSWADPSSTNQESVSEALNFAYGTFLWGETVNNANLRSLGALLYITESEAAKLYWFDVDQNINFNWQGGTYSQYHMTILRSYGGSYATFFSADDRWKHSIDILPENAGSLWLIWSPTRAQTIFNHFPAGGYPAWDEHGYHYNFVHAGFDATAARNAFNSYAVSEQWINPNFPHVNGNIPELYEWTFTLDSVGQYDNTVQADITGFSVFQKGPCKHYMVYMPPGKGPKAVHFSDGRTFNVPDDTVIVYRVCSAALPVEWIDFKVENIRNESSLLQWMVSEINNDYFQVQRSKDGIHWETIGRVASNGVNAVSKYTFTDGAPYQGINYYRIRQVDRDGQLSYGPIRMVEIGKENILMVFPNPANDQLNIYSTLGIAEDYDFTLTDVLGKIHSLNAEGTGNEKLIEISNFPSGCYFLQATHKISGEKLITKLIKE